MPTDLERRRSLLTAALGFLQVDQTKLPHTGLTALHTWLDNWRGIGAITDGMLRQGYETDLTGGPDGWSATFLKTRAIGGVEVVGSAHDDKPCGSTNGSGSSSAFAIDQRRRPNELQRSCRVARPTA